MTSLMDCLALIDGKDVATDAVLDVIDPSTGEKLATVTRCVDEHIDQAVGAARAAFESVWRFTTPTERGVLLRKLSELIKRDAEKLARLESLDTGKPLRQAQSDVAVAARYFDFYGCTIEAFYGETIGPARDLFLYTSREPYGVTGHIIPWNYPLQIAARTLAPALAAGNCCVLKPAEEAPLTPGRLGRLAMEAGIPQGVLNIVPGLGEEAGAALASHADLDHLSFTGSVEVGAIVSKAAATNIVPVTLELGGKSPNIVLADADLPTAVPVIVNSILQNAGQTCSAGSRLLVENEIHDQIVEEIVEAFDEVTIGPGIDNPDLGPLINQEQLQRVERFVESGRHAARLIFGGERPSDQRLKNGNFFRPTVFDQVPSDSMIAQEEAFGPILTVSTVSDLADAVKVANGTKYGLIAAVWTNDLSRAHWLAKEMRAGQVFVNTYGAGGGVELPFGGVKRSGFGREKGFEALSAFTQTKSVAIKLSGV